MCWGHISSSSTTVIITLPIAYSSTNYSFVGIPRTSAVGNEKTGLANIALSTSTVKYNINTVNDAGFVYWITLGY